MPLAPLNPSSVNGVDKELKLKVKALCSLSFFILESSQAGVIVVSCVIEVLCTAATYNLALEML